MTDPTAVEIVQLFLLFVSIPAYLWFISTIIRFRKKKPFDSSFFSLCLALAAADMQCLAANFIFEKCAKFQWLGIGELVRKYPNQMAKIFLCLYMWASLQQFTGVALIAFNRCTALAFINKHKKIWTKKFTRGAILYQFVAPLLLTTPFLVSGIENFSYKIDENGQIGSMTFMDPKIQLFSGILVASYLWLSNIFSAVMYSYSFCKARSYNNAVRPSLSGNRTNRSHSIASHSRERKLSLVGVMLASLMTIYGIVLMKCATATGEWWEFMMMLWSLINDIFSWSNPWLCLVLSPTIRKHMIAFIRCKEESMIVHRSKNAQKSNKSHGVLVKYDAH